MTTADRAAAPVSPTPAAAATALDARFAVPLLWGLAVLLLFFALAPLPGRGSLKAFVLEATAALLLGWGVLYRPWPRGRLRALLLAPPGPWVLLFLGWLLLSAARSAVPEFTFYEVMRHVGGALLFFAVAGGLSPRWLGRLVSVLTIAAATAVLQAVQLAGAANLERPFGAFRDPQVLGGVLCLLLPVALAACRYQVHVWRRTAAVMATVLIVVCLLATRSRSAWLGGLAGVGTLAALTLWRSWRAGELSVDPRQLVVPLVTAAVCAGMFLGVARQRALLSARAATFGQLPQDGTLHWRLALWRAAARMTVERPVLGWAPGTFPVHQARYTPGSRTEREIRLLGGDMSESAHNTFLQLAAETGLVGLLLFLGMLASFLRAALPAFLATRAGIRRGALAAAIAAVMAFGVSALGSPAWEFPEASAFFWTVLGMGAICLPRDLSAAPAG